MVALDFGQSVFTHACTAWIDARIPIHTYIYIYTRISIYIAVFHKPKFTYYIYAFVFTEHTYILYMFIWYMQICKYNIHYIYIRYAPDAWACAYIYIYMHTSGADGPHPSPRYGPFWTASISCYRRGAVEFGALHT